MGNCITKKTKRVQKSMPPSTSAAQCRSSFFLPNIRNKNKSGKREFIIKIKGIEYKVKELGIPLTELHRDILDAILLSKKKYRETPKGFQVLFCLSDVYKILNHRISKNKIKDKIQELRATTYFLQDPNDAFKYFDFNILNENEITGIEYKKGKGILAGKTNYYYIATIDHKFLDFENFDLQIYMNDEITKKIIELESANNKHLVRFCLSHDQINKDLDEVLTEIGIIDDMMSKQLKYKIKKEILSDKDMLFNNFHIEIKKIEKTGRLGIFYNKIKEIYFKNPATPLKYYLENITVP